MYVCTSTASQLYNVPIKFGYMIIDVYCNMYPAVIKSSTLTLVRALCGWVVGTMEKVNRAPRHQNRGMNSVVSKIRVMSLVVLIFTD